MCIWYLLEGLEILRLLAISGSAEIVHICFFLHLSLLILTCLHSDFELDFSDSPIMGVSGQRDDTRDFVSA